MALSALPDFTRRMSLTSPIFSLPALYTLTPTSVYALYSPIVVSAVFLLPAFVWADATPVMRATLKSVAATYLETMRFLLCFKAKLVAQMRGYIDCGQFFANLSRPDLPLADIAPPRQLLRSRLLGGGHRLVLTALDVLHPSGRWLLNTRDRQWAMLFQTQPIG